MTCSCCKTIVRSTNNNAQAFAAGANTLAIGTPTVDTTSAITSTTNGYTVTRAGLYHLSADINFTAAAAGLVTVQAYLDGNALPSTLCNVTAVADAQTPVHIEDDVKLVSVCPCRATAHTVTFVLTAATGVTGNVTHITTAIKAE